MKICLVTDAWAPQVNGVVRTLFRTREELTALGHSVSVVAPDQFFNLACPTYPEIRLAPFAGREVAARLAELAPDAVHISTEGPLGMAARRHCLSRGLPFTTAYHTRFPEYVAARFAVPLSWTYAWLRRFHATAWSVMVATASIEADLQSRGFGNIRRWSRGVDTQLFQPGDKSFLDLPRPIHLYVGRVAVEKNIEAFLALELDGSKVVVGDGPQLAELKRKHPGTRFLGAKTGVELAQHYAAADVFVFPSLTDTFGLVVLEALACGLPVAAFPVAGPKDILAGSHAGALDPDLRTAIDRALRIPPGVCRAWAERYTWRAATEQFLGNLAPIPH